MKPKVSIIMGSTSDLPVMEKAAALLNEFEVPFEMNALSAHRTPYEVETFASHARDNGIEVIIAAAGMAAHLPGVIASMTTLPVIGAGRKIRGCGQDGRACPGLRGYPESRIRAYRTVSETRSTRINLPHDSL